MAIIRCSRGHYYDNVKFSQCPHCGIFTLEDDDKTVALKPEKGRSEEKSVQLEPEAEGSRGIRLNPEKINQPAPGDSGDGGVQSKPEETNRPVSVASGDKTVDMYEEQKKELFVGWLVCVEGPHRGQDWHLYQGFNRLGRNEALDIPVMKDEKMGRNAVFAVVYDDRSNRFFAVQQPGENAYLNEEALQGAVPLKTGDRLRAGGSLFEFVAFCGERNVW